MAENTSKEDLLREGDISVEDNLEGMAGSKSSMVLSENAEQTALLTSMNETMKAMSESLRGSGETPTLKPADSAKRGRKTNNGSHDLLSDSAESDADQLLESNKRQKIQDGDEEEDTLLDEIVQSMNETEKTDAKISEKLEKIVENRWFKLSDGQLKEKTEKYLRPAICDNFITPKVNPEILERLDRQTRGRDLKLSTLQSTTTKMGYICTKATELLLQARRENKSLDIEQLIRMHTDALGLSGHISFEISQRRRDAIRPNLNKEYATLCASHVPITKMLFGDKQTQLNHIRASNKISNTTSTQGGNKGCSKQRGPSYLGSHSTSTGRNFLGRTSQTSQLSNRARNNRNYPLKKKLSQRSEVTTTSIINQVDSPQVRDNFIIMTTDASLSGWGACLDGMTTGGRWNPDEATHDINYLEMLAVLFALQSFSDKVLAKHIKLMVDNTIAVATINQMGTCHSNLNNKLEQQIWEWCSR